MSSVLPIIFKLLRLTILSDFSSYLQFIFISSSGRTFHCIGVYFCLFSKVDKFSVFNYCMYLYTWSRNLRVYYKCFFLCTEAAYFYRPRDVGWICGWQADNFYLLLLSREDDIQARSHSHDWDGKITSQYNRK